MTLNATVARTVSWLAFVMVLMVVTIVVMRYAFSLNFIWQTELVQALHAAMFLLVAGYALEVDRHVRVDVLYERFSEPRKRVINRIGTLLFLIPVCVTLLVVSYQYITDSWAIFESSREYSGLPGVFLIKTLIWGYAITLLLASARILRRTKK